METAENELRRRFERLKQYWAQDKQNKSLAMDVAQAALAAGAASEVITAFQETVMTHHHGDVEMLFVLGTLLLASEQYGEAASQFEALRGAANEHPAILYNLAYAHARASQHELAIETLAELGEPALDAMPEAYALMASACHHADRTSEAVRWARRFANKCPEKPDAWGDLAVIAYDDDDATTARIAAEEALRLDAGHFGGHLALGGLALETQDSNAATVHFSAALTRNDRSGRAWSGLAFANMLKLDLEIARGQFEKAVEFMPDHIGTWHGLAWVQILQSDIDLAEQSLVRAMDIDRNFGETHGGLAAIAAIRGQVAEAEQLARRALRLDPDSASARYAAAIIASRQGRQSEADQTMIDIIETSVPGGVAGLQKVMAGMGAISAQRSKNKKSLH